MIKRASLYFFLSLSLACCSTEQLNQTASGVLQATGNDSDQNKQIVSASTKVLSSLAPISYKNERGIGGSVAIDSFANQGALYPDANLQRYVNLVGRTLAKNTTRPEVDFSFAVLQSDVPNAWSAPGGYVFLTSALMKDMRDESELAGVLAHEMSHITEYHMIHMLKRQQFMQGVAEGAQSGSKDVSLEQVTQAADASNQVIFAQGFDQGMEFEADAVGIGVAAAAGYDPDGLTRFLERTGQEHGSTGGGWLSSTHPSTTTRVMKLRELEAKNFAGIEGARADTRFMAYTRGLTTQPAQ
ncbi:M48 family metalloprotease [soil metagenome]